MEATEQLRRAILNLPPARDAQEAYAGLLHLFAAAPLPSSLAWAMANITLGVDMHDAFTHAYGPLSHIHAIARRIPLSSTPPSKMDAHNAFVTLYTQRTPTSAHVAVEHHIALLTVASAHAHGLYPASLRALHDHPDYICAVAAARIQQGSYDCHREESPYARIGEAIGAIIAQKGNEVIGLGRLIDTANAYLAQRGEGRRLTADICRRQYDYFLDIPF